MVPVPVVLLGGDGPSTRIVYHALAREFGNVHAVLEGPVSRWRLLSRRARRLGWAAAAGQLLFVAGVVPVLQRRGAGRIARILREHGMDPSPIEPPPTRVDSVNSPAARDVLQELSPRVVVVNGTRVIGRDTLRAVPAPFINLHAGITPLYRGVHGGYWALCEGRPELAGTTVHLVDEGIDTGRVLGQACFAATAEDSFATYPYLHLAAGIPLLLRAVRDALEGRLQPGGGPGEGLPSRLRHHPTAWHYLRQRLTRGVR